MRISRNIMTYIYVQPRAGNHCVRRSSSVFPRVLKNPRSTRFTFSRRSSSSSRVNFRVMARLKLRFGERVSNSGRLGKQRRSLLPPICRGTDRTHDRWLFRWRRVLIRERLIIQDLRSAFQGDCYFTSWPGHEKWRLSS